MRKILKRFAPALCLSAAFLLGVSAPVLADNVGAITGVVINLFGAQPPRADGAASQVLSTNGAGQMAWITPGAGPTTSNWATVLANGAASGATNPILTDGQLFVFGAADASHPALKRSSTGLQVRLADDSGFTTTTTGRSWITDSGTVPSGLTPFTASDFMISTNSATTVREVAAGTTAPAIWTFTQSRGSIASPTANSSDDDIAWLNAQLYTGSAYAECARIAFTCDGAPSAGTSAPGRIDFYTVPSGSLTPVKRWSIKATGDLLAGSDNAYDIGASGATRPRNLYVGTGIYAPKAISAQASGPVSVTAAQSGCVFTNAGAAGSVTFNLPAWASGLTYTFCIEATQTLTITANGSDTLTIGTSTTAGGGSFAAGTQGYTVTFVATASGKWRAVAVTGTWS